MSYELFPLDSIGKLPLLIQENPNLFGLNVTIPYKESVIKYVDFLDDTAKSIGAVNVLKILREKTKHIIYGYNTDAAGFHSVLNKYNLEVHTSALILGTGGAAKAVAYVLKSLQINYQFVSRQATENALVYCQLNEKMIRENTLIINCTPLGMFPLTDTFPNIPYQEIGNTHLLIDLVYNPSETLFLQKGKQQGARIENGYEMLCYQAAASWQIWEEISY